MSISSKKRRQRTTRRVAIPAIERLEGRALLTSITEFGLSSGSVGFDITSGPDGALWFTEQGTDKIGRISTGGVVTEFSLPSESAPYSITSGPDGALWFTEPGTDKIGRITTTGTVTEFALSSNSDPYDITTGSDGNLWFTEHGTDKVGRIVPSGVSAGTITEFSLSSESAPWGITSGPNGNLWFTENGTNKVAQIVPSGLFAGVISEYSLSSGSGPRGISSGSDGAIWFIESDGNNVGQVTLGGSVTEYSIPDGGNPNDIVSGPDGALYFTPFLNDQIDRITTSGTFSTYSIPTSISRTVGIGIGPDNHVWFTEINASQIGRLNLDPVSADDAYVYLKNTPLTVNAASGVLANDTDPEDDALKIMSVVASPTHGEITVNVDGSFTYSPDPDYAGFDSFSYTATDYADVSNLVTVSLYGDSAPVAVNDSYLGSKNTALIIGTATGLLANDLDADGNPLTAIIVTQPAHGTLTLNTNGSFTYVPNIGFNGLDSFTYKDNDGTTDGSTATVSILVDTPPVAVNDSYDAVMNTPLSIGSPINGVLANDTDADGDPIIAIVVTQPASGVVTLNANGTFVYTPMFEYHGVDSFTYKVNDGSADGNTATVSIRVDAPAAAVDDGYNLIKNDSLTIDAPSGLLANDSDADADPITALLVTGPAHGTLTLNPNGSFHYVPTVGYAGIDSFTYEVYDGQNYSNVATVSLRVDTPPVAAPETYRTSLNTLLSVAGVNGALTNDFDADNDEFVASGVTSTAHGSLDFHADGSFIYVPDIGFSGTDSFTYVAFDGYAESNTVTVTIIVDSPPMAVADSYSTSQQHGLTVGTGLGVLANDTDADGDPITATLISGPSHGALVFNVNGSFTYTPDAGFYGVDSFSYQSSDGITQSSTPGTVTLVVTQDHAPQGVADNFIVTEGGIVASAPGLLANDTDADDDPITALLVSGTSHGTLAFQTDGSYVYIPNSSFGTFGSDHFTYRAFDGILAGNLVTVTLTFDGQFSPPEAETQAYAINQGATLTISALKGVLVGASDPWALNLTAVEVTPPSHGSLTLNADGSFVYHPDAGYSGTDSFTYQASNGHTQSAATTVTLTVTPTILVNHAPLTVADQYTTTAGQPHLSVSTLQGLLANDTDADADPISAVLVVSPTHGKLHFVADGSFVYTPNAGYTGPDSFVYRAYDGRLLGELATVSLTVSPHPEVFNDYDGDGKADIAVYMPELGSYAIRFSNGWLDQVIPFGIAGNGQTLPAPGDYDHSSKTELAVYLPSIGAFAYRPAGGGADVFIPFGMAGLGQSLPAQGDYLGTGQADIAVYMPSIGSFGIRSPLGGPDLIIPFGIAGAGQSIPSPGDYDGDGKTDLAVYMPSLGAFAYRPSGGGADVITPFGIAGMGQSLPIPGDYDGSGRTELAVYMPSIGDFAYRPAGGGADVVTPFGIAGEGQTLPSPADYLGTGRDLVAAYLPEAGIFAYRTGGGTPDTIQPFGVKRLGQTFPVTMVDQALAELTAPVSALSLSDLDLFPSIATRKKKFGSL